MDPNGTQLGGVMGFAGPDPNVDPMFDINVPVVHTGPDPCNSQDAVIYAFVQCDADLDGFFDLNNGDQWILVKTHSYLILPAKQIPIITLDDDVCNYIITPACPIDVLSITSLTAAPGEDPPPIDVEVGMACKNGYRLNQVRAKLKQTSECWIACTLFVTNIVRLAELNNFKI